MKAILVLSTIFLVQFMCAQDTLITKSNEVIIGKYTGTVGEYLTITDTLEAGHLVSYNDSKDLILENGKRFNTFRFHEGVVYRSYSDKEVSQINSEFAKKAVAEMTHIDLLEKSEAYQNASAVLFGVGLTAGIAGVLIGDTEGRVLLWAGSLALTISYSILISSVKKSNQAARKFRGL